MFLFLKIIFWFDIIWQSTTRADTRREMQHLVFGVRNFGGETDFFLKQSDKNMFALFILVLLNAKTIANADYVIEDTFEGESYKIYGPPTIPKQFSATLETVAHQSDKVSIRH